MQGMKFLKTDQNPRGTLEQRPVSDHGSIDPTHPLWPLWQHRVRHEQVRLAKARLEEVVAQLQQRGPSF